MRAEAWLAEAHAANVAGLQGNSALTLMSGIRAWCQMIVPAMSRLKTRLPCNHMMHHMASKCREPRCAGSILSRTSLCASTMGRRLCRRHPRALDRQPPALEDHPFVKALPILASRREAHHNEKWRGPGTHMATGKTFCADNPMCKSDTRSFLFLSDHQPPTTTVLRCRGAKSPPRLPGACHAPLRFQMHDALFQGREPCVLGRQNRFDRRAGLLQPADNCGELRVDRKRPS